MANNLDIGKYTPMATIVSMYLDAHSKPYTDFRKIWTLAFRAYQKVNQQFAAMPKSIRILIDGNKTAQLPSDYLSWSKIGIMDDNGMISSLKVNQALSILKDNNPKRLNYLTADINTSVGAIAAAPFFFNFFGNGAYYSAPLFGVVGGLLQYGECKVDEKHNVIIVPPDFKFSSIILEYISAPERDNDYQVESTLVEAIIAFLEWKTNLGPRQEFYACCIEARRTFENKRVTLQNINQIVRETSGMYLKA